MLEVGSLRLPGPTADVWAHEGFAYVGSENARKPLGIRIVSLANPKRPKLVASVARVPGTTQEDVAVLRVDTPAFQGNLLAAGIQAPDTTSTAPRGLDLWDVTNPRRPQHLAFWDSNPLGDAGARGVHELFMFQRDGHAYVAAMVPESEENEGLGEFRLLDVSDPRNPVQVSDWGAVKDGGLPLDLQRWPWGHSVTVNAAGTTAVCSFWDAGPVFLDISDPAHPRMTGRILYPEGDPGNTHSAVFTKDEQGLLVSHENLEALPGAEPWGYLKLYDIRSIEAAAQVGRFATGNAAAVPARTNGLFCIHNAVVQGDRAYLSWYSDGVRVLDISDLAAPVEIGSFKPQGAIVWGVHADGDLIVASDMRDGLYVLRMKP
jgi:hypothetical protein